MIVLSQREQRPLLDVSREKLTRLLSYFGSFLVFPLLVALVVGMLEQSATIGIDEKAEQFVDEVADLVVRYLQKS